LITLLCSFVNNYKGEERIILKSKIVDILILIFIIVLAIIYANSALDFKQSPNTIGAGYFPLLLSVLLVIFCLVSIFKAVKSTNNIKINLSNIKLIGLTTIIVGLFIYSWSTIGLFYVNVAIFIFLLITIYKRTNKVIPLLKNFTMAVSITIPVYLIFGLILNLSL